MGRYASLIGQRFGKLTVVEVLPDGRVRCKCDCGKESTPQLAMLKLGRSRSCGCGRSPTAAEDVGRFWSKVEQSATKGACWPWLGTITGSGYGNFWVGGRAVQATRYMYELMRGPVPTGQFIAHTCDNPACVNPDHLAPMSAAENMVDKVVKNRQARGARHGMAKLTEEQAQAIYALCQERKLTHAQIAETFQIGVGTVNNIACGSCWKHLRRPGSSRCAVRGVTEGKPYLDVPDLPAEQKSVG